MGGYVALSAVRRYPDYFRALMLMDTKASADTPEAARGREANADQIEASGLTDGLVAAIVALQRDCGRARSMGRAARESYERDFTADTMIDRYAALFAELARSGRATSNG